ncbi:MAG TPA: amidase family protein, partial [Humisphaera sp.]|nr:amidase family protein [Humisphaera sp.]
FHRADALGIQATGSQFIQWHERREKYGAGWREFFMDWDVLITPMTLTPAFEHSAVPNADRRLLIDGKEVEFEYMSFYPGLATLTGQPATAFPCGLAECGLPLGPQAIGPFLHDRTTIAFARLLEQEFYGFSPPPGYHGELA